MERYITNAFLPNNKVKLVLIDSRMKFIKKILQGMQIDCIEVPPCEKLYPAIACHPDIQCHPLGGNRVIVAPNVNESLKNQLIQQNFEIVVGNTRLEVNYPSNIAYNVARIGDFAFHNTTFTDPVLKAELLNQKVKLIHVNQGYAKCSIAIVDKTAIITSDAGVAKAAGKQGMDVLVIKPGSILLPGLNYGFIGGTCGLINRNELFFSGDLRNHPNYREIMDFGMKYGKVLKTIDDSYLYDVGSVIPLKEEVEI